MNILEILNNKANSPIDLRAKAKEPNRINVLQVAESSDNMLIAAAHGSGKTYSCLPIAHKAMYVSNRKALVEAKSKEFKSAMCVNSFCWQPIDSLNEHSYLILDEINGILKAVLGWSKVNYERFCILLNQFKGKILALDASGTEAIAKQLGNLSNKHFDFYQHNCGDRSKSIALTNSVEQVMQLSLSCGDGIRLIVCDKKATAKTLYETSVLPGEKHLITGENSYKAQKIIDEAAEQDNAWIFASPCLQEGFSIEYDNFVFNASVHEGCAKSEDDEKMVLLPVDAVIQGLFRVRKLDAARVYCSDNAVTEDIINEADKANELKVGFLERRDLLVDYTLKTISGICTPSEYIQSEKLKGFEAFSHLRHITSIQNWASKEEAIRLLQSFGFGIHDFSTTELDAVLEFSEPELEEAAIDEFMIQFIADKPYIEGFQKLMPGIIGYFEDEAKGYTEKMAMLRCSVAMYYGADKANDAEFIAKYYSHRYHEFAKKREYLFKLNLPNQGALHYEKKAAKFILLHKILKDVLGYDWVYLGKPTEKAHFVIDPKAIYGHELFGKLRKEFNASEGARQTWFWKKCMAGYFGFEYSKAGNARQGYKYKIDNAIRLVNFDSWWCIQDALTELQKDLPIPLDEFDKLVQDELGISLEQWLSRLHQYGWQEEATDLANSLLLKKSYSRSTKAHMST